MRGWHHGDVRSWRETNGSFVCLVFTFCNCCVFCLCLSVYTVYTLFDAIGIGLVVAATTAVGLGKSFTIDIEFGSLGVVRHLWKNSKEKDVALTDVISHVVTSKNSFPKFGSSGVWELWFIFIVIYIWNIYG